MKDQRIFPLVIIFRILIPFLWERNHINCLKKSKGCLPHYCTLRFTDFCEEIKILILKEKLRKVFYIFNHELECIRVSQALPRLVSKLT